MIDPHNTASRSKVKMLDQVSGERPVSVTLVTAVPATVAQMRMLVGRKTTANADSSREARRLHTLVRGLAGFGFSLVVVAAERMSQGK